MRHARMMAMMLLATLPPPRREDESEPAEDPRAWRPEDAHDRMADCFERASDSAASATAAMRRLGETIVAHDRMQHAADAVERSLFARRPESTETNRRSHLRADQRAAKKRRRAKKHARGW